LAKSRGLAPMIDRSFAYDVTGISRRGNQGIRPI